MPHKKHVVLALFYNGCWAIFVDSPPRKMAKSWKTMCVMGSWRPPDRHMEQRPTAFDPNFDVRADHTGPAVLRATMGAL